MGDGRKRFFFLLQRGLLATVVCEDYCYMPMHVLALCTHWTGFPSLLFGIVVGSLHDSVSSLLVIQFSSSLTFGISSSGCWGDPQLLVVGCPPFFFLLVVDAC